MANFTYTDSDKIVIEAWGKFKVTLLEAVEPGDLLSWYAADNAYTTQFADQSGSQRADCIALEAGAAGAEITAALKAELKTITTIATGGVATRVYFAGADDYLGKPLYLGAEGKPSSSEGGSLSQQIGVLLSRDRIMLDMTGANVLATPTFTGTVISTGNIVPATSNTPALGTASKMWSDLFLGSGAVINFNAGDITITHSTGTLTIASSQAVLAKTDGSAIINIDVTITGTSTGEANLCSAWFNLGAAAVLTGKNHLHTDGYWDVGCTLAAAGIYWAKFTASLSEDPSEFCIWDLNMVNDDSTIDAIFNVSNPLRCLGYVTATPATIVGSIPFFSTGGTKKYIALYATPTGG